jgi:sortase A
MPDRRSVDDLTIEELEQILRIRKRDARMDRLRRFEQLGRRPSDSSPVENVPDEPIANDDQSASIAYESFLYGASARGRSWRDRTLRDNLLLVVELLAAVGLIAIMATAALSLRNLNQEAASAQAESLANVPTPTATPIITTVVLPGGHTPPTDPGGAQPNYEEVPQYLRPLVEQQFAGPVIVPTPGPSGAISLRIPALGINAPIVQGDGWEQLKKGVGQHIGTADPGQTGNVVLSAHNDIYGEIFRHLDDLQPGDDIFIGTLSQEYHYQVSYYHVVAPTQVDVMAPTQEPIVSLISCYPFLVNSDRIVVLGELVSP